MTAEAHIEQLRLRLERLKAYQAGAALDPEAVYALLVRIVDAIEVLDIKTGRPRTP